MDTRIWIWHKMLKLVFFPLFIKYHQMPLNTTHWGPFVNFTTSADLLLIILPNYFNESSLNRGTTTLMKHHLVLFDGIRWTLWCLFAPLKQTYPYSQSSPQSYGNTSVGEWVSMLSVVFLATGYLSRIYLFLDRPCVRAPSRFSRCILNLG